jgi:type IV pilus assembly protein PilM
MIKVNFDIPLDFFHTAAPPLIGVDICTSSIKLVEFATLPKNAGYVLERYAIEPLPKGAVQDGNIDKIEVVAAALQQGWKRLGSRIHNVALALPTAAVITKKISLPAGLSEEDMEYQVEAEANQYIPFALDEVNLDFQVLGASAAGEEEVEVLLAASRKANIEDYVAVAQTAGLKAVVVDVESYAKERAFTLVGEQLPNGMCDKCIAFFDVGATSLNLDILCNGQPVYNRDHQLGGDQLTQQIQDSFGLSREKAEAGKRGEGVLPASYAHDLLQPFVDSVAAEATRALQFFYTSSQYTQVDYVVLSGGSAVLPGLDAAVAAATEVNTLVANPFGGMTLSSRIRPEILQRDAPALMTACGLALRRFDPL